MAVFAAALEMLLINKRTKTDKNEGSLSHIVSWHLAKKIIVAHI